MITRMVKLTIIHPLKLDGHLYFKKYDFYKEPAACKPVKQNEEHYVISL